MLLGILLILAKATITLAIPFSQTPPIAFLATLTNRVNTVRAEVLKLPVSDLQVGLNFSPCISDAICAGARRCLTITDDSGFQPCTKGCFCLPANPMDLICSSESDCDDGESCVSLRSAPEVPTLCISNVLVPDVSDDPPVTGTPTTTTGTGSSAINPVPVPVDEDNDSEALEASPEEDTG